MKIAVSIAAVLAVLGAVAGATSAQAQGPGRYGMWGDEPRDAYRAPPSGEYYEDSDYDAEPPSAYDAPPDYRAPPSAYDGPFPNYAYRDNERRGFRRWGGRSYREPEFSTPDRFSYPDDGYGGFDEPPSQRGDGQFDDETSPGVDGAVFQGGARPDIAPVAPPVVGFSGPYAPGSIVINVGARKLYYVNSNSTAYAYPIGVGRQGFSWTGTEKISRIAEWPDWYPPKEMRARKPELPAKMTGGLNNPLGARALYLGNSLYRVHGTNDPKSIGRAESSGCFRMMNGHVVHLASLAQIGASVSVVKSLGPNVATSGAKAFR
ncbi:MAG: L,D-transpeptidase family protein [Hyphomicrobium sp.]